MPDKDAAGPDETLVLSRLGKLLGRRCRRCRARLAQSLEVRASYNMREERWQASASCASCGEDVTAQARLLHALGQGPQRLNAVFQKIASRLWRD